MATPQTFSSSHLSTSIFVCAQLLVLFRHLLFYAWSQTSSLSESQDPPTPTASQCMGLESQNLDFNKIPN